MNIIKKEEMPKSINIKKITYFEIEFIKFERIFGVIANIMMITFLVQNSLIKVIKPNLKENKQ